MDCPFYFTNNYFIEKLKQFRLIHCPSCANALTKSCVGGRGSLCWQPHTIRLGLVLCGESLCEDCDEYLHSISMELVDKREGFLRFWHLCEILHRDQPVRGGRGEVVQDIEPAAPTRSKNKVRAVAHMPEYVPQHPVVKANHRRKRGLGGLDQLANLDDFWYGIGQSTRAAKRVRQDL